MRKADIANEVCEKIGIPKKDASDILELMLDSIKAVLQKGETVKIAGFGNFVVHHNGARKDLNPKPAEEIAITPCKVVTVRPSKVFKRFVGDAKPVEIPAPP